MYRAMQDSTRISCCRLARPRAHARLSGEANGGDLVLMRYFVVPKKWEEPDLLGEEPDLCNQCSLHTNLKTQ